MMRKAWIAMAVAVTAAGCVPGAGELFLTSSQVQAVQQNFEGALEASRQAIERAPDYPPARWRRGLWLLELGRLDEALQAAARAVELAPAEWHGRLALANVHLERGEAGDAAGLLDTLVVERPADGYARFLLGRALGVLGEAERAAVELARAGDAIPRWSDPWRDEVRALQVGYGVRLNEALDLLAEGLPHEALPRLEALHRERPGDVLLLGPLATAHAMKGDHGRALALLEAARERRPDHYRVELELALAHTRRGDLEAAVARTERALELHPDFAPAHYHLGALLERTGDPAGALERYGEAARLGYGELPLLAGLLRLQVQLGHAEAAAATRRRIAREFPDSPGGR